MLPSLDSLRCFAAAAEAPSFRSAARTVSLTPAALGQRIRQLEQLYGCRLYARTKRSRALTEAGLSLLPQARAALAAAEQCARAARQEIGPPPMSLMMGTRHELGLSFLLPLLPELEAVRPLLTLHLYFGAATDLLIRLRRGEIDCAVTSQRVDDPQLDSLRLHREDYVLVASPRLLRRAPLRRARDAAAHTLVDVGPECPLYRYWRETPGAPLLPFGGAWWAGTGEAIRRRLVGGFGVGVLPLYMVAADLRAGRLRRLFPRVPLMPDHFRLVFRREDARRSLFEALARTMLEHPLAG